MTLLTRSNSILSVACAAALLMAMANARVEAAQAPLENLVVHNAPKPLPSIKFEDEIGHARSLADFKGKVLVLNIWATWCVPCRREMPTLDRLQAALGGPDFEVVPVSIDRGGIDTVRKFYADIGVLSLAMFVDESGQVLHELGTIGLPTTLIVNRNGQEIGRITGPAEWDSAEIKQFLKLTIAKRDEITANVAQADRADFADQSRNAPGVLQRGLQWLKALFGK